MHIYKLVTVVINIIGLVLIWGKDETTELQKRPIEIWELNTSSYTAKFSKRTNKFNQLAPLDMHMRNYF